LEAGHYIVVPHTTGAMLRSFSHLDTPITLRQDREGNYEYNSFVFSVLNDIFRKIDLQLDGILTSRELNLFGKIIGDPFFKNLKPNSFGDPEFRNISHVPEGITRYGFFQLMSAYPEPMLIKMFEKLGYDRSLQSTKSRVFVVTFHSSEEIRVKIGNAMTSDINEKAANLMIVNHLEKMGANKAKEDRNVCVFRKYHEKAYANSYAAINKTSNPVKVTLDMTASNSSIFMPSNGKSEEIIPPNGIIYIGASNIDPNATSFSSAYSFTSQRL
jgi:hypothetical protein